MTEQSHRKADPVPTPAITTYTPTTDASQPSPPAKSNRDKGDKPEAQTTEE